jgi:hypothetical protein
MPGPRPKSERTVTPEQAARDQRLSTCDSAPVAPVQRAQIGLLAHQHPEWPQAESARRVGGRVSTGKRWRQRGPTTDGLRDAPRAGTPPPFPPLPRTQLVALAWSSPRQYGTGWARWSGAKRAQVAVEQRSGGTLSPGTIRRWVRADQLKPWRSPAWQPAPAPPCVEQAGPVLDLCAPAPALQGQGALSGWADEKTSRQARQRVPPPKAAAPGAVLQGADRYTRLGALPRFCALVVASGRTVAQPRATKKCVACNAVLPACFQRALCAGSKVLHGILANGPTPAP